MRTQAQNSGLISVTQSGMAPFALYRPRTINEATQLLRANDDVTVAAGCSDLIARIREGEEISRLLSLSAVGELSAIDFDADGVLHLGSMVTHHQGATSEVVAGAIPSLAAAWSTIATVRIRYAATLGGNLMAGRHRYELPIIFGALGAQERFDQTGRLLVGLDVPTQTLLYFGYERSMRPVTTVALAIRRFEGGPGVEITAAVGSEYRRTYILSTTVQAAVADSAGGTGWLDTSAVAATLAEQLPEESADYAGSAAYRRQLVRVLGMRLLTEAQTKEVW